jgi:hypothetical protein
MFNTLTAQSGIFQKFEIQTLAGIVSNTLRAEFRKVESTVYDATAVRPSPVAVPDDTPLPSRVHPPLSLGRSGPDRGVVTGHQPPPPSLAPSAPDHPAARKRASSTPQHAAALRRKHRPPRPFFSRHRPCSGRRSTHLMLPFPPIKGRHCWQERCTSPPSTSQTSSSPF